LNVSDRGGCFNKHHRIGGIGNDGQVVIKINTGPVADDFVSSQIIIGFYAESNITNTFCKVGSTVGQLRHSMHITKTIPFFLLLIIISISTINKNPDAYGRGLFQESIFTSYAFTLPFTLAITSSAILFGAGA